jgi:hypothetical protein
MESPAPQKTSPQDSPEPVPPVRGARSRSTTRRPKLGGPPPKRQARSRSAGSVAGRPIFALVDSIRCSTWCLTLRSSTYAAALQGHHTVRSDRDAIVNDCGEVWKTGSAKFHFSAGHSRRNREALNRAGFAGACLLQPTAHRRLRGAADLRRYPSRSLPTARRDPPVLRHHPDRSRTYFGPIAVRRLFLLHRSNPLKAQSLQQPKWLTPRR